VVSQARGSFCGSGSGGGARPQEVAEDGVDEAAGLRGAGAEEVDRLGNGRPPRHAKVKDLVGP
jgi:hypothetical protein